VAVTVATELEAVARDAEQVAGQELAVIVVVETEPLGEGVGHEELALPVEVTVTVVVAADWEAVLQS
jgi:hypothetical protein